MITAQTPCPSGAVSSQQKGVNVNAAGKGKKERKKKKKMRAQ
jgi:hypothetical protein